MGATSITVLNIGADVAERESLTHAFKSVGFAVLEAASADEALGLSAQLPNLILLDVDSLGIPAIEMCRRLRQDVATAMIPVVCLGRAPATPEFTTEPMPTDLADRSVDRPIAPADVVEIALDSLLQTRQSERLSHRFFETASDAVVIVDSTGSIIQLNARTEELFGYGRDELLDQPIEILIPECLRAQHVERRRAYIANPMPRRMDSGFSGVGRRKDGSEFPIDIALSPLATESGRFVACAVRDMTRQRKLEDELRQRTHDLADVNRHKDQFLATLAHELSSPLAAIAYAAELSRRSEVDPEIRNEAARIVLEETKFIGRLVSDLAELHRMQRGDIEVHRTLTDVTESARLAVEVSRPLIERCGHALELDIPQEAILTDGDDARLVQILTNLLNNAARYTPDGGRIRLSIERADNTAVIKVKDNGIGIPEAMLSRVFDLFTRLERARQRYAGGMGIGLAFVRQLVKSQGGSVEALSGGEGQGSEFVVRLPLADRRT